MKTLFYFIAVFLFFAENVNSQCLNIYDCWIKNFNGTSNKTDAFYDIKVSPFSRNAYATGETSSADGANADYITVKYDPNGDTLWTRIYNGTGDGKDIAYSLAIDNLENVYVTGESKGVSNTGQDYVTIKYDSAGVQQWVKRYDGPTGNGDFAYCVTVDASQNILVTGNAHISGGTGNDFLTIKYNPAGTVLWTKSIDFGSGDFANKVITDKSRNVYVIGYSLSTGGTGHDFRTVKYDSTGLLKWARQYNYPSDTHDEPYDVAVDNAGGVYVTGKTRGFFNDNLYLTVKYNSVGDLMWYKSYIGTDLGNIARSVVVDTLNGVYVTGESKLNHNNNDDFYTIKYNAATGAEIWNKRYNGTSNGQDKAVSVVLGHNGKIFVGGSSDGTGTNGDFFLIEYDMLTGDSCSASRYIQSSNEILNALSLSYDNGYVFTAGSTTQGVGLSDGMAARYCLLGTTNTVYSIKTAIEGFYNSNTDKLNINDTITSYLRKSTSPYNLVDSSKSVLDSASLVLTSIFKNTQSGNYYLVIKHRNSLETWSKTGGEFFTCGVELKYDFTSAASQGFGNNLKQVNTSPIRFADFSGDVNQNGNVDLSDVLIVYNDATAFVLGYKVSDVTGNNVSDLSDVLLTYNNSAAFVALKRP